MGAVAGLQPGRPDGGAGIVTYDDDGGHMVNRARLDRLLAGTCSSYTRDAD